VPRKDLIEASFAQTLIFLILFLASFAGYCLNQALGAVPIPFTIVPVFVISTFFRDLPIVTLVLIGLLDDCFSNSCIGLFPLCYSLMSSIITINKKHLENRKITWILFLLCVIFINFIYKK
jgi:hypothetical protein